MVVDESTLFVSEFKLDTTNFDGMLSELAMLTGKSFEDVIKGEVAAILGQSIENTKWADTKKIEARYTYLHEGLNEKTVKTIKVNGVMENVRRINKYGVMVHQKKRSYWDKDKLNPKWRPLQKALKSAMKYAKSMKGLSKATWYEIADNLKAVSMIRPKRALSKTMLSAWSKMQGTAVMPVIFGKEDGDVKYTITVKNYSSKAMSPGAGGMRAFVTAFGGRKEYFETNVSFGVFEKITKMAKKYPGMYTEKG